MKINLALTMLLLTSSACLSASEPGKSPYTTVEESESQDKQQIESIAGHEPASAPVPKEPSAEPEKASREEKTGAAARARELARREAEIERQMEAQGRVANERIDALAKYLGTLLKGRAIPLEKQDAMMAHLTEDRMRRTLLNMDEKAAKAYLEGAVELAEAAHIAQRAELEEKHEAERKEEVASGAPATGPAKSSAASSEKGIPFVTEPKSGTPQSHQAAAEFSKRVGKGPWLEQLPAAVTHKIAEFVGSEKKLELVHADIHMRMHAQSGHLPLVVARTATMRLNHQLANFLGEQTMRRARDTSEDLPSASAPLLADYEYAVTRDPRTRDLAHSVLRARGHTFCSTDLLPSIIVSGIKREGESVDAAAKRSTYKFANSRAEVYALGPSILGKPGNLLLRERNEHVSLSSTGRVLISTPTGLEIASIPDTKTIALLPLGFGTDANEIVAWNMPTNEFGYYAIDSKRFIVAHRISNVDLFGVPIYSPKPYSTLYVIHDNYTKLTIFDPRFKPLPWLTINFTLNPPMRKGDSMHIGSKWNEYNTLTNILFARTVGTDDDNARVDIYKVVSNESIDVLHHLTEPAILIVKDRARLEVLKGTSIGQFTSTDIQLLKRTVNRSSTSDDDKRAINGMLRSYDKMLAAQARRVKLEMLKGTDIDQLTRADVQFLQQVARRSDISDDDKRTIKVILQSYEKLLKSAPAKPARSAALTPVAEEESPVRASEEYQLPID